MIVTVAQVKGIKDIWDGERRTIVSYMKHKDVDIKEFMEIFLYHGLIASYYKFLLHTMTDYELLNLIEMTNRIAIKEYKETYPEEKDMDAVFTEMCDYLVTGKGLDIENIKERMQVAMDRAYNDNHRAAGRMMAIFSEGVKAFFNYKVDGRFVWKEDNYPSQAGRCFIRQGYNLNMHIMPSIKRDVMQLAIKILNERD